jgi:NAD-binding of NADP-dependent 3-hydroxyisobutyrate dehydrogenase/Transposase IS66 family
MFAAIGKRLFVVGEESFQANAVKLCGNFLLLSAIEGLAESVAFAREQGIAPPLLVNILTETLFTAPFYKTYGLLMVEDHYEPAGFRMQLGLNDADLLLEEAVRVGLRMPSASRVGDRPFDEDLKQIVRNFAALLKPMVETVDRFGLKSHFLRKHLVNVERFYKWLRRIEARNEVVEKCKQRFEKNSDKLFTFLRYDGVPWNNNNAEHAIKAFARLRDVIKGICTAKAVQEYLILLSVRQTCVYQGIDFLDFLRSGERSIDAFANNN